MSGATTAAERWRDALAQWAIPEAILAQAPEPPWAMPPSLFRHQPAAPVDDTPSRRAAREALGTTVLDVGCGGGAASLALAPPATEVTGIDERGAMLAELAGAAEHAGVRHREVEGRWPDVAGQVGRADVVVCHHVVYNVADLDPFVRQLTSHAGRRVVVELTARHPQSSLNPLWERFWGVVRPTEPTADLAVDVVRATGVAPQVERFQRPPRRHQHARADQVALVRRRLCLPAALDPEIDAALDELDELVDMVAVWWDVT